MGRGGFGSNDTRNDDGEYLERAVRSAIAPVYRVNRNIGGRVPSPPRPAPPLPPVMVPISKEEAAHLRRYRDSDAQSCNPALIEKTLVLVNVMRAPLPPLKLQPHLAAAAHNRSARMADAGKLSHDGWKEEVKKSRYPHFLRAENVARGYKSASSVVDGWLDSAGHRANIMNDKIIETGIGCVIDDDGALWWTQLFGS